MALAFAFFILGHGATNISYCYTWNHKENAKDTL